MNTVLDFMPRPPTLRATSRFGGCGDESASTGRAVQRLVQGRQGAPLGQAGGRGGGLRGVLAGAARPAAAGGAGRGIAGDCRGQGPQRHAAREEGAVKAARESGIVKACLGLLALRGVPAWRSNTGAAVYGTGA